MARMKPFEAVEWRVSGAGSHRGGNNSVGTLLEGDPDSPGNYALTIVRTGDSPGGSPRHRHDFEQIRLPLVGPQSYAPGKEVPVGWLGYFPEGVRYGPFDQYPEREFLLLQCGGPSGNGFLPYHRWREIGAELAEHGRFENGFYEDELDGGNVRRQDAFEAILERARSRPIAYPMPRYESPIILNPEAFDWLSIDHAPGVSERHLGAFNERGSEISQLSLEAAASYSIDADERVRLFFLSKGSVEVSDVMLTLHSAFSLAPLESEITVTNAAQSGEQAELLVLSLPLLASN
jgi:hypothetical protein